MGALILNYSFMIVTYLLCYIEGIKKRKILTPTFIFNFIWFLIILLYNFRLSYIQWDLSIKTILIFYACVLSYNLACHLCYYFKLNPFNLNYKYKFYTEKKMRIAKYIVIIVFLIECIYSKGFPVLWKIIGSHKTYFDFGIQSLHGAFNGLLVLLGAYTIFSKSRDKWLYLLIGILMISRQVLISMFIEGIIYLLFTRGKRINFKKLGLLLIVIALCFTLLGNFRSGNNTMNNVFKPVHRAEKLPDTVKWGYSYMVFSISNFNKLVGMTDGFKNYGVSTSKEFIPKAILGKMHLKENYKDYYLVSPNYTVSTYLPNLYLDFGIIGIIIFNFIIGLLGYYLYALVVKNKNDRNIMLYAVFIHNIIMIFFINMFTYLPVSIQFVYILLLINNIPTIKKSMPKKKENIAVLMATYNGEEYLKDQIDSILKQSYKNITLYIRDDNSNDKTVEIIKSYHNKYPNKVIFVTDKKRACGACKNFMYLLEYVFKLNKHNIYMFADQDDVWHKDKIELTVSEYYKQENTDIPLLIHTDLNVVDSNLKRINKSFIAYSNLNPYKNSFNDYLIQNNVTGCTMLINNKLVEKVSFKAKNIVMHDWYFAILASLFGKVVFLDKSTIDYRQHDKNVLGAQKVSSINYIKNKIKNSDIKADLIKDINQGKAVLSIYEKEIDDDKKNVLLNFCKLADKNKLCKLYIIIKYRFYKNGLSKLIGEILFI